MLFVSCFVLMVFPCRSESCFQRKKKDIFLFLTFCLEQLFKDLWVLNTPGSPGDFMQRLLPVNAT